MSVSTPSPRRRAWTARAAIAAVVLVPLAFAGLAVASLGDADESIDQIPAAVVNSDELVMQTAEDGTETPVFAGRQLVTELTGRGSDGFDWVITNAEDADAALAAGEVYAVLTVPEDFSASILSLQTEEPRATEIDIRTDDAHSYLSGTVAQTVGASMVSTFGNEITSQYLVGVYTSIGDLGAALGTAADGAGEIATGVGELGAGLGSLTTGTASVQTGAVGLADGVEGYTAGVGALRGALDQLDAGAGGLTTVSDGVARFTAGVSQLSAGIAAATAQLGDDDPTNDQVAIATIGALSAQLAQTAAGGSDLAAGTTQAVQGVQGGIGQSADGAATLAAGSSDLNSGANSIVIALGTITSGVADASTGADEIATGAGELASGLREGADQVPALDDAQKETAAEVATTPVGLETVRDNEVSGFGQLMATVFVPLGLWFGAFAVFLVLRPVSQPALASSAASGRIVSSSLARAGAIAVAQALLLVALMHGVLEVEWTMLPATLGFSLVMAFAFTAVHYLLTVGLGRAGLVISLLALALQITATGGVYPLELTAVPFQAISPFLPLTYAIAGMQAIIAGGTVGAAVVATVALIGFGVLFVVAALIAVPRIRRARTHRLLALPA